ncbi:MAG: Alpha-L-fucosidase [Planctomycetes bacterium ADurb.Bin126]|nr:MAG: Alpha-L-fucosidase [Planctomycetes bacterium ADurb.Bin126]HOD81498.1 alpha-L-fucosidase [Phycisphaerae bacterium]HQL76215.1 alpha-L-fucosidase [Phycisphaerae bacterium]
MDTSARRIAIAYWTVVGLLIPRLSAQPPAVPADDLLQPKREAVEAWKDMRFGMFICWGPVSLTGREIGWSRGAPTPVDEYDALYKKWTPDKFDARQWVQVVKDSGARYIVFLLKHHDGFCLWDTKQTDYSIMNGPFKRDVVKEIASACREQGIGFFPYYSTCDWHHPDFPLTSPGGKVKRQASNLDRYTEYLEAQVKELITGYGPLVGIWFDVPQCFDRARGERVIRHVRSLQRDILVNNRTGARGDFDTPEQNVGRCQFDRPWESCITLGTQWSWKPDDKLKPWTDAVRILVACAVGDGNLALNTNPMPDGRIEPRQVESFRKIGQWLKQYGESIYATRGGPFVAPGAAAVRAHGDKFALPGGRWWGGSTHKGNVVYLHILRWPGETIQVPPIPRKIVKHSVLTGGEATIKQTDAGIEVSVPADRRDALDTIVKLELDAPVGDLRLAPPSVRSGSLAFRCKAVASNVFQKQAQYAPARAFDDDPDTRWGCDWGTKSAWLEVDLGADKTFRRAWISEPYGRVQEFELQVWKNDAWQTFHKGKGIGENREIKFEPTTGRRVRLNLLRTSEGPSIWEFQLFER